jgi:hypothetical protein
MVAFGLYWKSNLQINQDSMWNSVRIIILKSNYQKKNQH